MCNAAQSATQRSRSSHQTEFTTTELHRTSYKTALSIHSAPWSFIRTVNLYCFKQSNFVGGGTADIDTLVSCDNCLKGFCQDASNCASVSSNVSSERTGCMCSHFCVRNLFTSQYIVHFKLSETPRHQILHLLQQLLYDFFLILVSNIKPCHTTYSYS